MPSVRRVMILSGCSFLAVIAAGVWIGERSVAAPKTEANPTTTTAKALPARLVAPPSSAAENAAPIRAEGMTSQQLAAAEASRTRSHPERLSPLAKPAPFVAAEYWKDPAAYCAIAEPGRVQQTLRVTSPQTPLLKVRGHAYTVAHQGEPKILEAEVPPGAPVSWFATAGGTFQESGMAAVTVQANAEGIARVSYIAGRDTVNFDPVMVGSPLAGQMRVIQVNVTPATAQR